MLAICRVGESGLHYLLLLCVVFLVLNSDEICDAVDLVRLCLFDFLPGAVDV